MENTNEIDIRNKFIEIFNNLEKYLRIENKVKFDESRYRKNLDISDNRLINNPNNKDTLIIAGKLRNLMSHNNNVAFPGESFLNNFETLVDKILSPRTVAEIMITVEKCIIAEPHQTLLEVSNNMKSSKISTVPILEHGVVKGIFNETSLFQSLIDSEGNITQSLKDSYFCNHLDRFGLESNQYYYYKFISNTLSVYDCLDMFEKGFSNDRRLELLFVTENGRATGKLIGIVSIFDLLEFV